MRNTLERPQPDLRDWVVPENLDFYQNLFAEIFGKAESAFLEAVGEESLPHILLGAFTLLDGKSLDDIAVRVGNPQPESQGWSSRFTTLEVSLSDRPFIVDSVLCELKRLGITSHHLIHPVFPVARDSQGSVLKNIPPPGSHLEAYELFLLDRVDDSELAHIESRVRSVLQDVVSATHDYLEMRGMVGKVSASLMQAAQSPCDPSTATELRESVDFLNWLDSNNFIFLSYQESQASSSNDEPSLIPVPDSMLGIPSHHQGRAGDESASLGEPSDDMAIRLTSRPLVVVAKSDLEATVHRQGKLDRILVKQIDSQLRVVREHCFLGLFTSTGLAAPVLDVPVLRERLAKIFELDGAVRGSHNFKQIVSILNSMPLEELFWSTPAQLHTEIRTIRSSPGDKAVRVTARMDPSQRGLLLVVMMHRDRFNAEVREQIEAILSELLQSRDIDYQLVLGEDEGQARLHFFISTKVKLSTLDLPQLEETLSTLTRTWYDGLRETLAATHEAGHARRLSASFRHAFSDGYQANTGYPTACLDIERLIARVEEKTDYQVAILASTDDSHAETASSVRIYHNQDNLVLSDVLPILEGLGLRVLLQSSHRAKFYHQRESCAATIDVFRVQDQWTRQPLELDPTSTQNLASAIVRLVGKEMENQKLNGLILRAGLTWREVSLLASYQAYLSQVSVSSSRTYISETMLAHPECAALIFRYFEAKFCPQQSDRLSRMEEIEKAFYGSLEAVSSFSFDRTLRALFNLVVATVRSNYYLMKDYNSHKIASAVVTEMPEPRPLYEIVVVGPQVEGIHLRGGMVARGGLRWSDRPDDFRTEVLGLLKTQTAKNSVIVPEGSKGGFVLKSPPSDREHLARHVREEYKTFIRGLLDLTDNIADGEVVHPPGLVIHDGPDPYLVVAADKGTAKFSDVANSVSHEYNFWLGDAFASGGSHGYDHKLQGITARGAWECVKRHFFEMGIDVMEEEFTCAAIGDMSGDVFGNGMLYTDKLQLQAAFNHLHIFIDPSPDAARSFQERTRLFALPHSSWQDYDKSLISRGGGVFLRASKQIDLSPEMQSMLATEQSQMNGQELVRAVMRMPVDLLWNGGIGTYVRASHEHDREIGDSNNDSVRVAGAELRTRVVGEGGNGGFTQAGRIEYARLGGRINTDAIDNSAGVDMSDHEVNFKILLQELVSDGELTPAERNRVLLSMTDDVTRSVLADNYWQSLCLSMVRRRSREDLPLFQSLLEYLETEGTLDIAGEGLPDTKSMQALIKSGQGLTRPELAIMLAYTKMDVYRKLLDSDVPDEPLLQRYLQDYFPEHLRTKYPERIQRHSLHREIIATQLTNTVINLLGITFVHRTIRDTGSTPVQVLRTALVAMELIDAREFLNQLTTAEKVSAENFQATLSVFVQRLENLVNWMLLTDADLCDLTAFMAVYREPLAQLRHLLKDVLSPPQAERLATEVQRHQDMGFSLEFSESVASLEYVPSGVRVVDSARLGGVSLSEATSRYYAVGDKLRISWLRERLGAIEADDKWSSIANAGLMVDLRQIQLKLSLIDLDLDTLPGKPVARYLQILTEIEREGNFGQATGDVLARMLAQIAEAAHREARQSQPASDQTASSADSDPRTPPPAQESAQRRLMAW